MKQGDALKICALLILMLGVGWSASIDMKEWPVWTRIVSGIVVWLTSYLTTTALLRLFRSVYERGVRDGGES